MVRRLELDRKVRHVGLIFFCNFRWVQLSGKKAQSIQIGWKGRWEHAVSAGYDGIYRWQCNGTEAAVLPRTMLAYMYEPSFLARKAPLVHGESRGLEHAQ